MLKVVNVCIPPCSIVYMSNSQTQHLKTNKKQNFICFKPKLQWLGLEINPIPKGLKKTKDLMALSYLWQCPQALEASAVVVWLFSTPAEIALWLHIGWPSA